VRKQNRLGVSKMEYTDRDITVGRDRSVVFKNHKIKQKKRYGGLIQEEKNR